MPWRILIPDRLQPPADVEQSVFGEETVFFMPVTEDPDAVSPEHWAQADAVLIWHEMELTASVLARLERCKVIVRIGVGFDNVDIEAAGAQGICVCNVPDYGTEDVADHSIGLVLAIERGLVSYDREARGGSWSWDAAGPLRRVRGLKLGIIGLGRIGTATAMRGRALGMDVLFYDPYKPVGYDKAMGFRQVHELRDFLSRVDVVSIHVPLTDETRNMADESFFAQLPPGAVFINAGRGQCHNMDALHDVLRSGHLRGAGLDVLPEEPPPADHPLIKAWKQEADWLQGRLIITPHAAFYNQESYAEMRRKAAEEALRVLEGRPPRSPVNKQWLKRQ